MMPDELPTSNWSSVQSFVVPCNDWQNLSIIPNNLAYISKRWCGMNLVLATFSITQYFLLSFKFFSVLTQSNKLMEVSNARLREDIRLNFRLKFFSSIIGFVRYEMTFLQNEDN